MRAILLAALLLAGGAYAWRTWSFNRTHESTDNAQVDGEILPVVAKVGGYVAEVTAAENGHVDAGAPLVRLDAREYEARLAQAQAELDAAQVTAGGGRTPGQAAASLEGATSQRDAGSAQVAAARAALTKARADLARATVLADKQVISRAQLDAAQAAFDAAQAALTAAERQVAAAGAGIDVARAGVRLASARLAAARAARDQAALQRDFTRLDAPMAGTVSRKAVEVGQLVQPGQTLLAIVADTGAFVTANFKETQLARLRVGQPATLTVDAYGADAEGVVESIASATGARFALLPPDNATGNFTKVVQRVPVRIRITRGLGPDRPLRPGMSVTAAVTVR
ncbi:MAG: HlyD family secretion protein [Gemmatimonadetes bacterium]|nr:HlyD family secretion protein [Gemmatimonadota bacterium]